jgi:hypothetical protein
MVEGLIPAAKEEVVGEAVAGPPLVNVFKIV